MKPDIQKVHTVWNGLSNEKTDQPTFLPKIKFDEIMGSLFTSGPFAYFILDFYDMQISQVSASFEEMFGISAAGLTLNDILGRVHPDDMDFVARAETVSVQILYNKIGKEKVPHYKTTYCFRG